MGGNVNAVIASLIAPPCHISAIAQLGIEYAHCLGMTTEHFIKTAGKIRRGKI
jgi:hypothetical protein